MKKPLGILLILLGGVCLFSCKKVVPLPQGEWKIIKLDPTLLDSLKNGINNQLSLANNPLFNYSFEITSSPIPTEKDLKEFDSKYPLIHDYRSGITLQGDTLVDLQFKLGFKKLQKDENTYFILNKALYHLRESPDNQFNLIPFARNPKFGYYIELRDNNQKVISLLMAQMKIQKADKSHMGQSILPFGFSSPINKDEKPTLSPINETDRYMDIIKQNIPNIMGCDSSDLKIYSSGNWETKD